MSILSGFFKTKKYRKTDGGYKLQSEWTSSETVEMNDGTTLENKLKWKSVSSATEGLTGINTVSIPENAEELLIKANMGGGSSEDNPDKTNPDVVIDIYLPVITLYETTLQSFRSGYVQEVNNGLKGGMVRFSANKSNITLEAAYLNSNAVTATTRWTVYYR